MYSMAPFQRSDSGQTPDVSLLSSFITSMAIPLNSNAIFGAVGEVQSR